MKIYDTLSKQKVEFMPIDDKKVRLFVCGPTVYDNPHLGNAKTYTQFDFMARYLRFLGYDVYYLQNITNLDDKIISRAREAGITWNKLTEKYEKVYMEDMKKLNNTSVTKYARATDYIEQIVKQVKTLLTKGYAYKIDDGIYFEISKFPNYGKLSGRSNLEESDSVTRIDENKQKRGWNDFCLWKFSKPDEPSWKTDIGEGRPGWHIEDTAITETFFGPQYDIHGGAVDLIIPHHEAEIAQMESASGKSPLVKYWVHAAFLIVDGKKMSKSLGNFYTIDDVIEKQFDPISLRYFFLGAHYRETLNFTWDSLSASQAALNKLRSQISSQRAQTGRSVLSKEKEQKVDKFREEFRAAMDDDFNTPQALAVLWSMLKSNIPSGDKYDLAMSFDEVLGLDLAKTPKTSKIPDDIKLLLKKREILRKEGKFEEADKIRQQVEKSGFQVKDNSL